MEAKAARPYSKKGKWEVVKQQHRTEIVTRKPRGLYEDRQRKSPYNGHRNSMVWKANQSRASPEDQPLKNVGHVSKGSPVCRFWISGNCTRGEKCRFLHPWSLCPGLGTLAALEGHNKVVKGIALPHGSDKLYSAADDGTLRLWDCHTGRCVNVIHLGAKAGSLISESPWVFVGLPNTVKALNIQAAAEFNLEGPVGQVNAIAVGNNMLFAGAADGVISVWKGNTETDPFKYTASLRGHNGPVVCFVVGAQRLYSGSTDRTIRVWDLNSLQCIMALKEHTDTVMSLLCWDQYLFSCSLDQTIKVWAAAGGGNLEVIYTHKEQHGVLSICGLHDADAKPIIFCSCNDRTVKVYDIPSFKERGRVFSTLDVVILEHGPGGLIFSGDKSGKLTVWNLSSAYSTTS